MLELCRRSVFGRRRFDMRGMRGGHVPSEHGSVRLRGLHGGELLRSDGPDGSVGPVCSRTSLSFRFHLMSALRGRQLLRVGGPVGGLGYVRAGELFRGISHGVHVV